MAKGVSGLPSRKRKSQSKPSAPEPAAQAQPAAASRPETSNALKRYEVPADFQENSAPLSMQTELLDLDSELWLFQLPHELDPAASLTWQLSITAEGGVTGTCQDAEGVSYSLAEEPSEMATQLYTTPAAGSSMLSRFKRRVTVVRANQIPDAMAQAEAIEAVMPSADMPGIPSASLSLIHQVPSATVQKQQQQQDQQAGQDLLTTPEEPKSKQKKAKSEAKKLKKRAQEATAVNEKQSKLQRQSDAPVLAPEALQVSVGPEVKSQAAVLQEDVVATASDDKKHKKGKKDKKDKKLSSVKKRKQKDASSV